MPCCFSLRALEPQRMKRRRFSSMNRWTSLSSEGRRWISSTQTVVPDRSPRSRRGTELRNPWRSASLLSLLAWTSSGCRSTCASESPEYELFRNELYTGRFPTGTRLEVKGLALQGRRIEIDMEARLPHGTRSEHDRCAPARET